MQDRTSSKTPKHDSKEEQPVKHGEDYGSRGLHGEAGTTKDESVKKEGGATRDDEAGSDKSSKGRRTTPGQSQDDKDKIAGRRLVE